MFLILAAASVLLLVLSQYIPMPQKVLPVNELWDETTSEILSYFPVIKTQNSHEVKLTSLLTVAPDTVQDYVLYLAQMIEASSEVDLSEEEKRNVIEAWVEFRPSLKEEGIGTPEDFNNYLDALRRDSIIEFKVGSFREQTPLSDPPHLVTASSVFDVSLSESGPGLIATIRMNGQAPYDVVELERRRMLAVDIKGTKNTIPWHSKDVRCGALLSVRNSQFRVSPYVTRIVFDLSSWTGYRIQGFTEDGLLVAFGQAVASRKPAAAPVQSKPEKPAPSKVEAGPEVIKAEKPPAEKASPGVLSKKDLDQIATLVADLLNKRDKKAEDSNKKKQDRFKVPKRKIK